MPLTPCHTDASAQYQKEVNVHNRKFGGSSGFRKSPHCLKIADEGGGSDFRLDRLGMVAGWREARMVLLAMAMCHRRCRIRRYEGDGRNGDSR